MIFHKSKIIFIHIPKTGGTTIEKLLTENPTVGQPATEFGVHHRLEQVFEKWAGERTPRSQKKDIGNYRTFVVARNPWERYSSMYAHDFKAFDDGLSPSKPLPIERYIKESVTETFFKMIEVKSAIPDNIMILNFDDFENEVIRVWGVLGLEPPVLVHENEKESDYHKLQRHICTVPVFQQAVAEMCAEEIELFGYDLFI